VSQPVKLSDALVLDARIAGEAQERSIAGQIEFWAKLGRAIDSLLDGRESARLRQIGAARPLSEALSEVDTPAGRERVRQVLARQPFPHFEQHPTDKRLLVKIDQDGTRTVGRFVNREFVAEPSAGKRAAKRSRPRDSQTLRGKLATGAKPESRRARA
jgi:hypothetical protein